MKKVANTTYVLAVHEVTRAQHIDTLCIKVIREKRTQTCKAGHVIYVDVNSDTKNKKNLTIAKNVSMICVKTV